MSKEAKSPTPLSVMLADGEIFDAQGISYTVKPLKLKDTNEFMKDNLSLGTQIFNVSNEKIQKKVDRWLTSYCLDENENSVSLEKAMEDGWDIVDLKKFFKKLCDISG